MYYQGSKGQSGFHEGYAERARPSHLATRKLLGPLEKADRGLVVMGKRVNKVREIEVISIDPTFRNGDREEKKRGRMIKD